ncbi:MAG: Stk1 family PASTA domain-containing Ser/Thr kinase [Actinomycetales bacterium]
MRASQDSLVGRVLDGRYRVTSRIARGGMATVYLATDSRLDREVAVKVMHPHLADDPQFVARFHREAKAAAQMSHPSIVAVFDQGQQGDDVYLVMEYVPGTTLRDLLNERGALTVGETLEVLEPLLDALSAAHRAGFVHRDVKPENVLITADGRVKVADFGLARAASLSHSSATTGMLMGTAAYLSPELVTRGVADARSDVYAAGIMTFEMLTGRQPYVGEVPIQVAFQHVNEQVPAPSTLDPGLPVAVDEIVTWSTARDPDLRPRDAAELRALAHQVHSQLSDAELDRIPAAPPVVPVVAQTGGIGPTPSSPHPTRVVGDEPSDDPVPTPADGLVQGGADPTDDHQHAIPLTAAEPPEPTRRRRGPLILVAMIVLAVVLGGVGWFFTAGPGAYITTPSVTGTAEQAKATLTEQGLRMEQVDEYSDEVPIGEVIRTDPAAGERVRKGGTVTVVVTKDTLTTGTPSIVDSSPEAATDTLAAQGLALGETTGEEYSESIDEGNIVSQSPAAEEPIQRGDAVSIVVSKGRQPIDVPAVAGQSASNATSAIEAAGLRATTSTEYSETVEQGVVIRQSPRSGTLFRGDTVRLVVSAGPPLVPVPNVINLSSAEATQQLQAAGFQVNVEKVLGGAFDTVREQNPSGGTAPKGSTVTIRVV